ncbi:hypothetical protein CDAR_379811 [Caerostris darwini]|uniref:Uncharacterized protein n=1 Tax=Caerostris darwini TaxID=1538125 RepID=A0AAV4T9R0_9ARAC|nr:hypothetical protein CDAR_379811 [Caerostris darwini]
MLLTSAASEDFSHVDFANENESENDARSQQCSCTYASSILCVRLDAIYSSIVCVYGTKDYNVKKIESPAKCEIQTVIRSLSAMMSNPLAYLL